MASNPQPSEHRILEMLPLRVWQDNVIEDGEMVFGFYNSVVYRYFKGIRKSKHSQILTRILIEILAMISLIAVNLRLHIDIPDSSPF